MQVADRTNAFRRGQYLRALPASEEPPALLVGSYFRFLPGFLLGLVFGPNPAGEVLGQGHYGWAIWGAAFLLSCPAGALAQVRKRRTAEKEKDSA